MGKVIFTDDFKINTVHQVVERRYPVPEVSQSLSIGLRPNSHLVIWRIRRLFELLPKRHKKRKRLYHKDTSIIRLEPKSPTTSGASISFMTG